ncbi:MAG: glycosyltransferase family 9 protein [Desulfovibrionales bacterium]
MVTPSLAKVRKILVCQQRQIGDVVLAIPVIDLLAQRFPDAAIHFFTEKKCAPILENHPALDRIWTLDKSATFSGQLGLYAALGRQRFDLVVDLQQLPRCRFVTLFSLSPLRLSYTPRWYNRLLYNLHADPEPGYAAQSKASILAPLGITWNGELPRIHLREQEQDRAVSYMLKLGVGPEDMFITVDPTHKRVTRRWPPHHFSTLLRMASDRWPQAKFLVLFGPGEAQEVRGIVQASGSTRCLLPDRVLSLRESAALMQKARLHLGTCSAPRHIAAAVGTPTLTIMGSTTPDSWTCPSGPHDVAVFDLECRPCNRDQCDTLRCLEHLEPEKVLEKMGKMLIDQG